MVDVNRLNAITEETTEVIKDTIISIMLIDFFKENEVSPTDASRVMKRLINMVDNRVVEKHLEGGCHGCPANCI